MALVKWLRIEPQNNVFDNNRPKFAVFIEINV